MGAVVADKKIVFVAFAIEDESMRDLLKGHTLHPRNPYEYIDMSVKEAYVETDWKEKVRTRIRRSQGMIVLISKNSPSSTGQKWEIQCAKEEKIPTYGLWIYKDDRTTITGVTGHVWTWDGVAGFIDGL
jgi:predicted secreted protein